MFTTPVDIPTPAFRFSYDDCILMLGSCFADNIGERLRENKFCVTVNPFGTLYNPASIAEAIQLLFRREELTEADLFYHEGLYHSFAHHSRYSRPQVVDCLEEMNRDLRVASDDLYKTTRLIVTFGTAYVYRLKKTGKVVANCHKLPEQEFLRERLTVEQITTEWRAILQQLWEYCPGIKVLFTVSPIRHNRDGAHENQLSKSTLLLATDMICREFPEQTGYFPAYEIMMDELRDYRYYAEDMIHPSALAVKYIWQRFTEAMMSGNTRQVYEEWKVLKQAIDHRPLHPENEKYQLFVQQTLQKIEQFQSKYPNFDCSEGENELRSRLM